MREARCFDVIRAEKIRKNYLEVKFTSTVKRKEMTMRLKPDEIRLIKTEQKSL